jgi:hypothetical protein
MQGLHCVSSHCASIMAMPRRRCGARDGLQQVAVVAAQEAGLHQHAVAHAMRIQARQVLLDGDVVGRRIAARVGHRQAARKHVRMGVDALRR